MLKMTRAFRKDPDRYMSATATYTVEDTRGPGQINTRMGNLWRPDNRYPGDWMMRRHESGGVELTFTGSQHNSKEIKKIIPADQVDRFILSLLECREWPT